MPVLVGVGFGNFHNSVEGPLDYLRSRVTLPSGIRWNGSNANYDGHTVDPEYIEPSSPIIMDVDNDTEMDEALLECVRDDNDYLVRCSKDGLFTGPFTIPNRGPDDGRIIIDTDEASGAILDLTSPQGTRMTPDDRDYMPTFNIGSSNGTIFSFETGCRKVDFRRLNITNGATHHSSSQLIDLAPAGYAQASDFCQFIRFLQIVAIPELEADLITRAIFLDGYDIAVADSYIFGFYAGSPGPDSQALSITRGGARWSILNNRLTGGSENFAVGGGTVLAGMNPSDIEIRRNYFKKLDSWIGGAFLVKNHLEFKLGKRIFIEGNVFDGCWADAQDAYSQVFWSVNQPGTNNPTAETSNITQRFNIIKNSGAGWQLTDILDADNLSIPMYNVDIFQNLVKLPETKDGGSGAKRTIQLLAAAADATISPGVRNLSFRNNSGGNSSADLVMSNWQTQDRHRNLYIANNIFPTASLGIFNSNGSGQTVLDEVCFPTPIVRKNVAASGAGSFTDEDLIVADTAAEKFVNYSTDMALQGDSPAKLFGDDGRDAGANAALVEAACADVEDDDYEWPTGALAVLDATGELVTAANTAAITALQKLAVRFQINGDKFTSIADGESKDLFAIADSTPTTSRKITCWISRAAGDITLNIFPVEAGGVGTLGSNAIAAATFNAAYKYRIYIGYDIAQAEKVVIAIYENNAGVITEIDRKTYNFGSLATLNQATAGGVCVNSNSLWINHGLSAGTYDYFCINGNIKVQANEDDIPDASDTDIVAAWRMNDNTGTSAAELNGGQALAGTGLSWLSGGDW